MTNKMIHTYDPRPDGGLSIGRNWWNANVIQAIEVVNKEKKNGTVERVFRTIDESKIHDSPPYWNHGKTTKQKSNPDFYRGTKWTMTEGAGIGDDAMIGANAAAIAMTETPLSQEDGWTQENKGFLVEYYGFHGANQSNYQKWAWEIYNDTANRLSLPVKGIYFTLRFPSSSEEKMFAINNETNNHCNKSKKSRSEQVAVNQMYGLWWHPKSGKYHIFEMTLNGNRHAGSADPETEGTRFHTDYWFADSPQTEGGNARHINSKGKTVYCAAWTNNPLVEECQYCGFAMQCVVDHAATQGSPHTMQMGDVSPVPFHIDRSGRFQAVMGGLSTEGSNSEFRSIYAT